MGSAGHLAVSVGHQTASADHRSDSVGPLICSSGVRIDPVRRPTRSANRQIRPGELQMISSGRQHDASSGLTP